MAGRGRPRKYPVGEERTSTEYARDRYSKLRSEGKCAKCGKADAAQGRTRCKNCLTRGRESDRLRRKPKPRVRIIKDPGLARESKNLYNRERYQRLKSSGLCVRCMEPSRKGTTLCAKCSAAMSSHNQKSMRKKRMGQ